MLDVIFTSEWSREFRLGKNAHKTQWNLVKTIEDGCGDIKELEFLFFSSQNILKRDLFDLLEKTSLIISVSIIVIRTKVPAVKT